MEKKNTIERLINTAEKEIGYLEKRSEKDLDSFTANAGRGNYTKYWRDVKPGHPESFQTEGVYAEKVITTAIFREPSSVVPNIPRWKKRKILPNVSVNLLNGQAG